MQKSEWIDHIRQALRENKIQTIRVTLHDNSNIQRARYVPVRYFLENVMQGSITFPSVVFSMDTSATVQQEAGDGFAGGYPSWVLKPDLSTFGLLPHSPGMARVIADIYTPDGVPIATSPRHVLRQVLDKFTQERIKVFGAFEYEFYVFKQGDKGLNPIWTGMQCFSEVKQAEVEDIITSVLYGLTEMGAGPEVANTEYGSGQFEVTNSPFWGVEIADMAFYYRTSIREILHHKGYTSTFMSKPVANTSGSGAHMNHSLYDEAGNNLFYDEKKPDGLSDICRWFIGGQLRHARALTALCNPNINSFKRLQPYSFAPATPTWGYEHRGAMIRVPMARGQHLRLENRLPGADTNPYVSLAAILAAGLDGIQNQIEPPEPLRNQDAYASPDRLPKSMPEALEALDNDPWAKEMLGEEFIQHYITLRQAEWERFHNHITDWELNEYMGIY